jgi:hypothetical protein
VSSSSLSMMSRIPPRGDVTWAALAIAAYLPSVARLFLEITFIRALPLAEVDVRGTHEAKTDDLLFL